MGGDVRGRGGRGVKTVLLNFKPLSPRVSYHADLFSQLSARFFKVK